VGGAYGTGMLTRAQTEGLYTYRDPHLTESYETFAKAPEALAGREYTEKDLTEFIVGAVSEMDSPKKPNAEAKELDRRYFCGITDAMLAADRKAMCSVTAETIRAQAADLADRMANATRVVFGSKDAVEAGKQLFDRIETL
ncbi:peptidase M16, partial [Faecalibacterium duncaniae]|nr:peptidase M16 [Faecalibacterium duncaniae]